MVTAMAYPEGRHGKRNDLLTSFLKKEVEDKPPSAGHISKARYVLRNNFTPDGQQAMVTAMAYPNAQRGGDRKSGSFNKLDSEFSKASLSQARYVLRNNFTPEGQQYPDRCLAVMAERIQARAIRRCGELLKQIEDNNRGRPAKIHDAADMNLTRTEAATQAGLSERQKVTALRVAYAVRLPADYPWHIHVNG